MNRISSKSDYSGPKAMMNVKNQIIPLEVMDARAKLDIVNYSLSVEWLEVGTKALGIVSATEQAESACAALPTDNLLEISRQSLR